MGNITHRDLYIASVLEKVPNLPKNTLQSAHVWRVVIPGDLGLVTFPEMCD